MTIKRLILVLLVWFSFAGWAQDFKYKTAAQDKNANFYDIVTQQRQYFKNLKNSGHWTHKNQKAYKQFERWAYIWKDRVNADGSFPTTRQMPDKRSFVNLLLHKQVARQAEDFSNNTWQVVGPTHNVNQNGYDAYPGMGRINVVAPAPSNEQIMYAGAAAGGVWKTTNGGNTWTPVGDSFAGMGVTDILVDPNNANKVYVATGDEDGRQISTIGIFMTTDGGANWGPTGLAYSLGEHEFIRDLAFSPINSNVIFALTTSHIWRSDNGGANWVDVNVNYSPYQSFTAYFQTIVFDPDDADKVVVSDYYGGLYVSTDGGHSFALHQGIPGGNSRNILKLTTTPDDSNYFYGLDDTGRFMKFRFAMDNTANDLVSTTQIQGFNAQGGYNVVLAVSPNNKNNIIAAGVRGYVSTNNGQSFSVKMNPYNNPPGVGFYVHPDHHHLSFLSDGSTVIDGHDGGVHKGGFSSNNWTDISNGLVITQSYNIAITQALNGDDFMMANQDNDGFSKVLKNGIHQWVAAASGDGTTAGIDYNDPNIRYLGGTNGALYRTTDGFAASAYSGTQLIAPDGSAAFVSPMAIHPVNPQVIYAARGDLYKSTNRGDNWVALSSGNTPITYINLTTYNNSTRICLVGNNGTGSYSSDDGNTWHAVSVPNGLRLTSLIAKPDSNTLYASVADYGNEKVIKSTDNGLNWASMSTGLPNVVAKRLVLKTDENNETLFLGTELGVYWKNNTMASWQKLGTGLPNVIVNDLRINYAGQELYVGTFGRGMWKISVDNSQAVSFNEKEKPVVYPNPVTHHRITIKLNESLLHKSNLNYEIYNVLGGVVKKGSLNQLQTEVLLDQLYKGVYMIKISNDKNAMVQKLIVN